jgi:hypothetical protein
VFVTPAVISKQYSQMPDGETFFCFAKVITDPGGRFTRARHRLLDRAGHRRPAYADALPPLDNERVVVTTGISCRFCERADCNQRAARSYRFAFAVDEYVK